MFLEVDKDEYYAIVEALHNKDNDSLAYKLKNQALCQESEIGRTTVVWQECDIESEFENRFERKPTKEELEDIRDNYLRELNDVGGESAIEQGWNIIYEAIDDWESDNEAAE